jgi:protein-S-isoprenylcysteine O-methyltransferase Ste14
MMRNPFLVRVVSRTLLGALFAVIAVVQITEAMRTSSWSVRTHDGLSAALWATFAALVIIRPVPIHRTSDKLGVAVALGAQGGALAVGLVTGGSGDGVALQAGTVLLAGGLVFAIASVAFLGRCFGVLPDVRGLVTRGPYRFVRHPLYLGEVTALLGVAIACRSWAIAVPLWVVTVVLQLARTRFEERSLLAVFPEYGEYARRTKRLIPGLV